MKKIGVLFKGWGQSWSLGTLADNGRTLLFEYSPEALQKGIEFSPRHLKLRTAAYGEFPSYLQGLPGLVADALPDGWGLLLMDKLFRKRGLNPAALSSLDRLAFINGRALGAFVFEPSEQMALPAQDRALLALATEALTVIEGAEDIEALKELAVMGGSPHGARPKVLVNYDAASRRVSALEGAAGTPWLVKFQAQNEHKEVCAIEHAYGLMAKACELDMPDTRYFDLSKSLAGFGIARFDREAGMRVPVHTLAGALHVDFRLPSLDYSIFLRATRMFTRDELEVKKAFGRCVFNVVFNNRDDHAKNFSYRMNAQLQWKLAPAYDLTFNEGAGGEHQMSVMGEGRVPAKSHLLALAKDTGLDTAWAAQVIHEICQQAKGLPAQLKAQPVRPATRKLIETAVASNVARMG